MTKGMTKLVNCDKIAQMNVYYFDEFLWASTVDVIVNIINIIENIIEHTWGKWNLKEKTKKKRLNGGGKYGKISA